MLGKEQQIQGDAGFLPLACSSCAPAGEDRRILSIALAVESFTGPGKAPPLDVLQT